MLSLARTTTRCALLLRACAVLAVSISLAPAALAQGTVKAVFEKLDLLGRYGQDCARPTAADNLLIIHQAVEGDRVRRDQFTSPTDRQFSLLVDRASSARPGCSPTSGTIWCCKSTASACA